MESFTSENVTEEGGKFLSRMEKIQRGESEVVNEFRIRGMFNKDGELFSEIAVKKTSEDPSVSGREDRNG